MDGLNFIGNFVQAEFPIVIELWDKFVTRPLQNPPWKVLMWFVIVAIAGGILLTLVPLRVLHYVHGTHFTKVLPVLRRVGLVRTVTDTFYMFLVVKLRILWVIVSMLWQLMLLPLVVMNRAFGSLARIRLIVLLATVPALLLYYTGAAYRIFAEYFLDGAGGPNSTRLSARTLGRVSLGVTALMIGFIIVAYIKMPVLYMFCFDTISPLTMVITVIAIALYVHLSMVIYIDNVLAGRAGTKKVRVRDLTAKQVELTVIVTCAMVFGLFLLMASNPGVFAREGLLTPRLIALE
jgi:hypothetical protein